jgi:hypothetical protein
MMNESQNASVHAYLALHFGQGWQQLCCQPVPLLLLDQSGRVLQCVTNVNVHICCLMSITA